jgi:hypothetical protein
MRRRASWAMTNIYQYLYFEVDNVGIFRVAHEAL